jgi:hypothetical protein
MRFSPPAAIGIMVIFLAGFFSHFLYLRWNPPAPATVESGISRINAAHQSAGAEAQSFRVTYVPFSVPAKLQLDLPLLQARDVEKIRGLTGTAARIRGRIFRVGHSAKSNTYFLNFGPSRAALTAVIFASAVELFEKNKLPPKGFEGKEVELAGEIKDHPQYGLEIILENPAQIKVVE